MGGFLLCACEKMKLGRINRGDYFNFNFEIEITRLVLCLVRYGVRQGNPLKKHLHFVKCVL